MRYDKKQKLIELTLNELCPDARRTRNTQNLHDVNADLRLLRFSGNPHGSEVEIQRLELIDEFEGLKFSVTAKAAVGHMDGTVILLLFADAPPKSTLNSTDAATTADRNSAADTEEPATPAQKPAKEKTFRFPCDYDLCLAFMLCRSLGLDSITLELLLVAPDGSIAEHKGQIRQIDSLRSVFEKQIKKILPKAKMTAERAESVLAPAAKVIFPFKSLRNGQERMMRECYDAMLSGARLFVQAPTGIGKTLSALYPAVKFLGNGRCDKIFYLTAKSSTQNEAYRAAGRLFEAGARLRTIIISAKESCCMMRGLRPRDLPCGSFRCRNSYASESRMNDAVHRLLEMQNGYEQSVISKVAREFAVCPYELSLELSEYCDIIIADYNYAFDPLVRLERYFTDPDNSSRYVFLIDEAHNLADRTREMYSATITTNDLIPLARMVNEICDPSLFHALGRASQGLEKLRGLCRDNMSRGEDGILRGYSVDSTLPAWFSDSLSDLASECYDRMMKPSGGETANLAAALYRKLSRFFVAASRFDERFVFYSEIEGDNIKAKIYCLDPSEILGELLERSDAAVMFSATLTPLDYFSDILGGGAKSRTLSLPSPYRRENLYIAAAANVSTRLEDRDKNIPRIVSYIAAAISGRRGNYIAYFPSYNFMQKAAELFSKKYPSVKVVIQRPEMTRSEREEFINTFKDDDGIMRIGFCVLGGVFSEGIDLPGRALIGAVIVGVGIPGISGERNIIRDYYEISRGTGYDYAYTYPGMNSVLQAAGRVIRGEDDRGIVLLIDDRYATTKYSSMFPEHWQGLQYFDSPASLSAAVSAFWRRGRL